jgi:hypothetical protein
MKKLLTSLFISASLFGYAQNFLVTNAEGAPYTDGETIAKAITEDDLFYGEYKVAIALINITENPITMNTLRTNIELPEGIKAYVCCLKNCYEEDVFYISGQIEPSQHDDYELHIYPDGHFGLSKFKLEFWTKEDQTDMFTLYVEINLPDVGVKENKNATASLLAYPNPASAHSNINISYTLADKNDGQRLVIKNILGATVMNIPLNPYDNNISIDASTLKPGAYFYAIENKNQISIAKKLIIK